MIERAAKEKLHGELILSDSAYGNSSEFRDTIRLYVCSRNAGVPSDCTKTSKDSLASTTLRDVSSQAGITTFRWSYVATPSWSQSAHALFSPRRTGKVKAVRTRSRPERHFADSFITARLAIAHFLTRWLPRCPLCHQQHPTSQCEEMTSAA